VRFIHCLFSLLSTSKLLLSQWFFPTLLAKRKSLTKVSPTSKRLRSSEYAAMSTTTRLDFEMILNTRLNIWLLKPKIWGTHFNQRCSSCRQLLLFGHCSSCYWFRAWGIVSVEYSIVPLKEIEPFLWDHKGATSSPNYLGVNLSCFCLSKIMGDSKMLTILDSSKELPALLYSVKSRAVIFPLCEKPTWKAENNRN